jgi:HEAT repeat protein
MVTNGEEALAKGFVMRIAWLGLCATVLLAVAHGPALAQKKGEAKSQFEATPQLGGKTFSQWLAELKTTKDPSKSENAIRTILMFGPDEAQQALPTLLGILRRHNPVSSPIDTSVRVNAIMAIGAICRAGASKEPPEHKHVEEAVTLLKRQLRDEERIIRFRAAEALGNIGTDAKAAIPELINTLGDRKTWEARQAAAFALGMVAVDYKKGAPPDVLEALFRALRDSSTRVRYTAVQALTRLGVPAQASLRLGLEKALDAAARSDTDPTVQIWAHMAVMGLHMKLDKKTDEWRITAIGKLLHSPELQTRMQAAQALGVLGTRAKQEVPRLQAALNDPDPNVVVLSIQALAQMGTAARPAVAGLQSIANDPRQNEVLKRTAQQAVDMIEGRAKDKGAKKEAGK